MCRPTELIVHIDRISENFREACRIVGDVSLVIPVVKSNAYGHGSVEVTKALIKAGARQFAVSLTEEGLELRRAGIDLPIIVLGGSFPGEAREIVEKELTCVVSTYSMAEALQEAAAARSVAIIHIKVETGLGRLGILPEDIIPFVGSLNKKPFIAVEGICSTFSSVADKELSEKQFRIFEEAADEAERVCQRPLVRHIAHTGGLLCGLNRPRWFVRPGIMLYGYTRGLPYDRIELKPCLTWKTEVFKVQAYPVGHPIGYGGTYKTKEGSRIALLPVGFSDGLLRPYMGKGEVLICGQRVPFVGRSSMDWTTVDVGSIPEVRSGDEVVLLGEQGKESITADEMADRAGTNIDEILISIGKRVPRRHTG
jgi:alanine racemase